MLTPYILPSCLLSSTADNSKLVTSSNLCSTLTHACTACSLHRTITILLPDSVLPDDFQHWPQEPKIPVFYKFWPLKTINKSRSVWQITSSVVLVLFFSVLYLPWLRTVLCTIVYVLYCIVVLLTVILCFIWLFGYFGRKVDH